tara:strand:+ start:234 stop:413 length:180 start_codon:yes stop_codon:yes gene_type:complete
MFKHLNNKQLIDTINKRYANGLNDDDYVAELVRRRKNQNNQIAFVDGDLFKLIEGELNE